MYKDKLEDTKLCSSTIATVVAKHLNSASKDKNSQKPLHVLLDTGTEESFLIKKWTKFGVSAKIDENQLDYWSRYNGYF